MENPALPSKSFGEILRLNQENQKLKAEIEHLKELLLHKAQIVTNNAGKSASAEEVICKEQLELLGAISKTRELTHEETRKVDTYVKLLDIIRKREEEPHDPSKGMSTDELLASLNE